MTIQDYEKLKATIEELFPGRFNWKKECDDYGTEIVFIDLVKHEGMNTIITNTYRLEFHYSISEGKFKILLFRHERIVERDFIGVYEFKESMNRLRGYIDIKGVDHIIEILRKHHHTIIKEITE